MFPGVGLLVIKTSSDLLATGLDQCTDLQYLLRMTPCKHEKDIYMLHPKIFPTSHNVKPSTLAKESLFAFGLYNPFSMHSGASAPAPPVS